MDIELPKKDRCLLKIFMAASKKAITRRWLNTEPPTVSQWEAIIKDIQTMELLTFSLRLQRDKGVASGKNGTFISGEEVIIRLNALYILAKKNNDHITVYIVYDDISDDLLSTPWFSHVCSYDCAHVYMCNYIYMDMFMIIWTYGCRWTRAHMCPGAQAYVYVSTFCFSSFSSVVSFVPIRSLQS